MPSLLSLKDYFDPVTFESLRYYPRFRITPEQTRKEPEPLESLVDLNMDVINRERISQLRELIVSYLPIKMSQVTRFANINQLLRYLEGSGSKSASEIASETGLPLPLVGACLVLRDLEQGSE